MRPELHYHPDYKGYLVRIRHKRPRFFAHSWEVSLYHYASRSRLYTTGNTEVEAVGRAKRLVDLLVISA